MRIRPREWPALARRGWETLRAEGPQAAWLRAERRLFGAQGRVFRDYAAWAGQAPAPPVGPAGPPLSVITPVCDPSPGGLVELLAGLRAQSHPWELCLADDASRSAEVRRILDQAARDPRVRLVRHPRRLGPAAATNAATALAGFPALAYLDHDDLLAPHALALAAAPLTDARVDLVYSDEDKLDPAGRRASPFLKPAFDPLLLLGTNYLSHLLVVRRELVDALGGLRPAYDGSQDYDLVLRASERARLIAHVPRVLYHWRATPDSLARSPLAKEWAYPAARRALEDALRRRGEAGRVRPGRFLGTWAVEREPLVAPEDVSAIVAADRPPAWLRGLPLREVLCVGSGRAADRQRAAERARGAHLLYLGSVRARGPARAALDALLAQAGRRGVGFVSGQVLDRRGRVTAQGLALGHGPGALIGLPEPALGPDAPGYYGLAALPRSASAVGDEALLVPRALLLELGGWRLDGRAGAVELCWRGAGSGWRTVVTPAASFARQGAGPAPVDPRLRAALCNGPGDGHAAGEPPLDPFWSPAFQRGAPDLRLRPAPPGAPAWRVVRAADGAWRL